MCATSENEPGAQARPGRAWRGCLGDWQAVIVAALASQFLGIDALSSVI